MRGVGDDDDPQRRARRIRAFRDECDALAREGVFAPTPAQQEALDTYHGRLLASLARQFDVDLTDTQHSLSLGLRLTTIVAAAALSIGALLVLRRFWGFLVAPAQVAVAIVAPVAAFLALDWSARSPRRQRVTSVLVLVAVAAVVANVEILGTLFGFAPSPVALLLHGVVGVALAYAYGSRIALVAGAGCLTVFAMTLPVAWQGAWWDESLRRPETALLVGLVFIAASSLEGPRREFGAWWRGIGCAVTAAALVLLSVDGTMTWLPSTEERPVEVAYTISAFAAGLAMIVIGARRRWMDVSMCGAVLVLVMLLAQYFEWWWRYVPQWLFFLVVGAAALGTGLLLTRVRRLGGRES